MFINQMIRNCILLKILELSNLRNQKKENLKAVKSCLKSLDLENVDGTINHQFNVLSAAIGFREISQIVSFKPIQAYQNINRMSDNARPFVWKQCDKVSQESLENMNIK